ncbi:MAG: prephenate dehydrogenase [Acidobacteriota bacterium]
MKVAIVGLGLIGTSIKLAVRRAWPDCAILEIDRGESIVTAGEADLVVLAVPVDVIVDMLRLHAALFKRTFVLDTGSTKRAIVRAADEAGLPTFVGGHPMGGGTATGPATARADLFAGRPWFLVPHRARPQATMLAHAFVERLGARPIVLHDDGSEHDRVMAAVSHLPQVVASVLMKVVSTAVGPERLGWSGAGLRDTTRLAEADAVVWKSILASNRDELAPLMHELARTLSTVAGQLADATAIEELFDTAARARQALA